MKMEARDWVTGQMIDRIQREAEARDQRSCIKGGAKPRFRTIWAVTTIYRGKHSSTLPSLLLTMLTVKHQQCVRMCVHTCSLAHSCNLNFC